MNVLKIVKLEDYIYMRRLYVSRFFYSSLLYRIFYFQKWLVHQWQREEGLFTGNDNTLFPRKIPDSQAKNIQKSTGFFNEYLIPLINLRYINIPYDGNIFLIYN